MELKQQSFQESSRDCRVMMATIDSCRGNKKLHTSVGISTGLVLSGGGARGAYQIGCWRAFLDRKLTFSAVAGSSIGALNGALICQGSWDSAHKLWLSLTRLTILGLDFRRLVKLAAVAVGDLGLLLMPIPDVRFLRALKYTSSLLKIASRHGSLGALRMHGLINIKKFEPLLRRFINMRKIQLQPAALLFTVCKNPRATNPFGEPDWFRVQDQSEEDAWNILAASMSVPFVFSAIELHGDQYSDGGIGQWLPIEPLYRNGVRRMVIVSTKANTSYDPARYPGCAFTLIQPPKPLGRFPVATFRFTERAVLGWMEQGYQDAIRVLERDEAFLGN
jgi:NTE family protein